MSDNNPSVGVFPELALHPFHRLPADLLYQIFQEVQCSSRHADWLYIPPSVVLSHVCRLWRNIVLDTATLWTDIRIYNGLTDHFSDMYLERSRSCLIDVIYHFHDSSNAGSIFRLLPHMARVRRLTIMTECDSLLGSIMSAFKEVAAPHLESIRISLFYSQLFQGRVPDIPPLFTDGAALLHSVQFNGVPPIMQPQFTRLTSFTFRYSHFGGTIYLREFLDLLTNVSQTLIRLRVEDANFSMVLANTTSPPVELFLLESLDILRTHILPFLHTPGLRSLYLRDVGPLTVLTFRERCLSSELSALESLKLDRLDLSCFEGQTAVVRGLPRLTRLVFWGCANEDTFLLLLGGTDARNKERQNVGRYYDQDQHASTDFSIHQTTPKIMPHLRSLTVSNRTTWSVLQAVIQDRIAKGIPLGHVRSAENVAYRRTRERWLTDRNIGCEVYNYKTEETADQEDREWMEEEAYFREVAKGYGSRILTIFHWSNW